LAVLVGATSLGIGAALPLGRGIRDVKGLILPSQLREEVSMKLKALKQDYESFISVNLTSSLSEVYSLCRIHISEPTRQRRSWG
ncbi:hypothetical protein, partial [Streptococcus pneumoniae]|uniref:hypothetical protein n=1 Tax=Streptococcus pneumoniae TaxID=1313 RepID=UPI001E4868EA